MTLRLLGIFDVEVLLAGGTNWVLSDPIFRGGLTVR